MKDYLVARIKERDTQVVIMAGIYTVIRAFVPVPYQSLVDTIAGVFGVGIAATPIR